MGRRAEMLNQIIDNPNYLSIALAFLGLIGGGFASWIVTFIYFKKGQTLKLMCFSHSSTSYLGHNQGDFHDLSVRYGEKQLANPFRYTLYVWNCGSVTINGDDISAIDPLAFGRNDIEILETTSIWSTRDSINPKLLIDAAKNKVVFEFDFLDPNDGFAVQFLADKTSSDSWWQTNLQCYGTVKGLNRSLYQVDATFEKAHWWSTVIGFGVFLFLTLCSIAMAYDAWLSGFVLTSIARVLASGIFGVIALFALMITFDNRTWSSPEVIPSLLRKANSTSQYDIPPHILSDLSQHP
jgi:hypothetical protein